MPVETIEENKITKSRPVFVGKKLKIQKREEQDKNQQQSKFAATG